MATTSVKALARNDPRHGTQNGYGNLGCRCDRCRDAQTAYMREGGHGSYERVPCPNCDGTKTVAARVCRACAYADREAPHGTEARYKRCHCDECRAAAAAARQRRRTADIEAARTYNREYKRRAKAAA